MYTIYLSRARFLGVATAAAVVMPACTGSIATTAGDTEQSTSGGSTTDNPTTGDGSSTGVDTTGTTGSTGGDVTTGGSSGGSTGDGSTGEPGAVCGPGTEQCGDICTALAFDPDNCGQCGNACADGEACDGGSCVLECSGEASNCDGSCVVLANDPAHCGACDNACGADQLCQAGQCVSLCGDGGLVQCGGACVDLSDDTAHCGQCDNPCGDGEQCVEGQCAEPKAPPAVYTMTNDPAGNRILSFARAPDGSLSPAGSFTATGGLGTGAGLGNQRGLVFDPAQELFFAVNAGDHSISMLSLEPDGSLTLLANVDSGGERPISVTVAGNYVYVVNAGVMMNNTAGNISGFEIAGADLLPIPDSTLPLSAANPNPAQIQFSPDGAALVVSEKATNILTTYTVESGLAAGPVVNVSAGQTPFGFDFSAGGQLLVSEAWGGMPGLSSTSSYKLGPNAVLTAVSPAVATTRTAACWLATVGDYAYVANAQTDDITGFKVAGDGALTLLDADGVTAQATDAPVDLDVTDDLEYLYVVNNAAHALSVLHVEPDGSLTKKPDFAGLPSTASGIVAR